FHHRPAEIDVRFPEQQVRVVAARRPSRVGRTDVAARRDVGRGAVAADERARLVRGVVQGLEGGAAPLGRRDDARSGRVHLDVAAERADRDFLVRVVVLVEPGAADAFRMVDAVGDDLGLILDAEALIAGLLALVAAADVEPLQTDAGRFRQRAPYVG